MWSISLGGVCLLWAEDRVICRLEDQAEELEQTRVEEEHAEELYHEVMNYMDEFLKLK